MYTVGDVSLIEATPTVSISLPCPHTWRGLPRNNISSLEHGFLRCRVFHLDYQPAPRVHYVLVRPSGKNPPQQFSIPSQVWRGRL